MLASSHKPKMISKMSNWYQFVVIMNMQTKKTPGTASIMLEVKGSQNLFGQLCVILAGYTE